LPGVNEENHENLSIAGELAKIQTEYLPHVKFSALPLDQPVRPYEVQYTTSITKRCFCC
jgi:hypothetical protein